MMLLNASNSRKMHWVSAVTDQQVKNVEQFLNDRPVRKFNYQTPNQVLEGKIALFLSYKYLFRKN
jgi:IS30 family transposase